MGAKDKLLALAVPGILLASATAALPQNWTLTSAPITNWSAIAMSVDGSRLVAAVQNGLIYVSTNAGSNWTGTSAPVTNWSFVASSADGSRLAALANDGGPAGGGFCWIFTSGDSGATWAQCSLTDRVWSSLGMSADGSKLVTLPLSTYTGGPFVYSTNFGATWSALPGPYRALTVTCAANGLHLFVTAQPAPVYCELFASTNFGVTWNLLGATSWYGALTSSSDGHTLMADAASGQLAVSTNYGATMKVANLPTSERGWSSACSADGSTLIAAGLDVAWPVIVPLFYISTNSGITWVSNAPPSTNATSLASLALSADGRRMAAIVPGGGTYIWQTTPAPVLCITPADGSFVISWIVPSIPFVLQENSDLATPNWTDVITTPILNFTNLHHEVSVPLSSSNRFYRLKSL